MHPAVALGREDDPWALLSRHMDDPERRFSLFAGMGPGGWDLGEPRRNVLVLAPSQSGKTTGVIVPAILQAPGPVVSTSTKGDVFEATALCRARMGNLWHFAPDGTPTLPGCTQLRWSPITASKIWDKALTLARSMAGAAGAGDGTTNASYFLLKATELIAPLLHAAALGDKPIAWLLRAVAEDKGTLAEAERILDRSGTDDGEQAADLLRSITKADARTRGPVFATASTVFFAYRTSAAQATTNKPNFVAENFVAGSPGVYNHDRSIDLPQLEGSIFNRDRGPGFADTIYITSGGSRQAAVAPLVVGLLSEIREAVYEMNEEDRRTRHTARRPTLFALDELANIAPMDDLPATLSQCAGQGLLVLAALQDLSQAEARWGVEGKGFLSMFGHVLVFRGIRNTSTLRDLVEVIGQQRVLKTTHSTSQTSGQGPTSSSSQHEELEAFFDTGAIAAGRTGVGDRSPGDARRMLRLNPDGWQWAHATPFYNSHPYPEMLIGSMRYAAEHFSARELRAAVPAPALDVAGTGVELSRVGPHFVQAYHGTLRELDGLQRKRQQWVSFKNTYPPFLDWSGPTPERQRQWWYGTILVCSPTPLDVDALHARICSSEIRGRVLQPHERDLAVSLGEELGLDSVDMHWRIEIDEVRLDVGVLPTSHAAYTTTSLFPTRPATVLVMQHAGHGAWIIAKHIVKAFSDEHQLALQFPNDVGEPIPLTKELLS